MIKNAMTLFPAEADCPSCRGEEEFRCQESGECIEDSRRCDRKIDCRDGSDEYKCPYWKTRQDLEE